MTNNRAQAGLPDPVNEAVRLLRAGGSFSSEAHTPDFIHDIVLRLRDLVLGLRRVASLERKAAKGVQRDAARAVLLDLTNTVEAAGGLDSEGNPVGDPEWFDLGNVYIDACVEVGKPRYV